MCLTEPACAHRSCSWQISEVDGLNLAGVGDGDQRSHAARVDSDLARQVAGP